MKRKSGRSLPVILIRSKLIIIFIFISLTITHIAFADVFSECFTAAGDKYNISPILLRCIAETESSLDVNATHKNNDHTYDVGIMQINSFWKDILREKSWKLTVENPYYNIFVGAWILAGCIQRFGYNWQAVSCYHTGGKCFDAVYVEKVYKCCHVQAE